HHTCAIRKNGKLTCWGMGSDPDSEENRVLDHDQAVPPSGDDFVDVTAGVFHSCAMHAGGSVECWGKSPNTDKHPEFDPSTAPDGTFETIRGGEKHTCGLRSNGRIRCWGGFDFMQWPSSTETGYEDVAPGWTFTCGLKEDGSINCWGHGEEPNGSFGRKDTLEGDRDTYAFDHDQAIPPEGRYTDVATSSSQHACAIDESGKVTCWGRGTVENEMDSSRDYGQSDPPAGSFEQLSLGYEFSCGLRTDGRVQCWGRNNWGQTDPDGGYTDASTCTDDFSPRWEPNDTRETASTLTVGRKSARERTDRSTACPRETDWYSLENTLKGKYSTRSTAKKGDRLEAAITWANYPTDTQPKQIPPNLTLELLHESPDGSIEVVETASVEKVLNYKHMHWWSLTHKIDQSKNLKYYLRVTGAEVKHQYNIAFWTRTADSPEVPCESDKYEPNDTKSSAAEQSILGGGRLCSGDVDVYKTTLGAGRYRQILAEYPPTVDMQMRVVADSNAVEIDDLNTNTASEPRDAKWVETPDIADANQDEYTIYVFLRNVSHTPYVGSYSLDTERP
ncbi:MAG: RCC1 domain-containing protein, partial [Bradymonadaceae bacterium]